MRIGQEIRCLPYVGFSKHRPFGRCFLFKTVLIPNRKSCRAEILRQWSPPTMCHVSHVNCHVSDVTCRIFLLLFLSFHLDKVVQLVEEGSGINGA